jgi:hypothetical protein
MRDLHALLQRAAARGWTFTVAPAHHTEVGWWAARTPLDVHADVSLAETLAMHWGSVVIAVCEGHTPRGRLLTDVWESGDSDCAIVDVQGAALVALFEEGL